MPARKKTAAPKKQTTSSRAKKNLPAKQEAKVPAVSTDNLRSMEGLGLENILPEDQTIPFLSIIQSNSPQLRKNHEKYLKDAQTGDIFNTVTGELFESVSVIPCSCNKVFVEWVPRDAGGGFVACHPRNSEIVVNNPRDPKTRHRELENGNLLVETMQYYVIVLPDNGEPYPAVIGMSSTQLGFARKWNTVMANRKLRDSNNKVFTPPMFAYQYQLYTTEQSNEHGEWCGWAADFEGILVEDDTLLEMAYGLQKTMVSEAVSPNYASSTEAVEETAY